MESQALVVQQRSGSHGVPISRGSKQFRTLSSVHSVGKQPWQFRVAKKLTLRPQRTSSGIGVRAKISGFQFPGTQKVKKGEESGKEDDSASGTATKLPGTLKVSGRVPPKDDKLVFVAGATGKVGRRVVRELVQQGYSVRAGVRNFEKAQFLVKFAAGIEESPAAEDEDEENPKKEPEKKPPSLWASFIPGNLFGSAKKKSKAGVELVEFDLGGDFDMEAALGKASVVVCAIGASEKEVLNVSAPYQVDYKATEKLIEAATQAKVKHFVLVTSLGTTKAGWPAVILNLFWGVLIWKAKAEKALMESGIPFTIVRPGGMERPTDTYKETHNVLLDKADSRFGGQVSNLQVAELIGGIVSNLGLAQNKILEIVAETTAPLRTFEDLLAEIPSISDTNKDKKASNDLEAEKKTEEEKIKSAKLEEQKAAKQRDEEEKMAKQEELKAAKQRAEEEKLAKREEAKAAKQRAEEEKQARLKEQRAEKQRLEEERLAKQEQFAAEKAAEKEKVEALRQKLQDQYMDAKEREEEAQREADEAVSNKADIEKRVSELRAKAEAAAQAARESKALEVAVIAAARERKTLSEQEKSEVVASVRQVVAREAKEKEAQEKAEQQEKAAQKLKAKAEAEKKKKAEEAKVKAEAERAAKAEADKQAKAVAAKQAKAKAEEEEKAKVEADLKKKAEAEEKAKVEAAMEVKKEAEENVKIEAEKKAKKEAEEKAKVEAEKKAKEAEEKAKVEAELKAKKEAEVKAKKEAEIKATKEREEKAKVEAEMKAKEAEEKAKAAAEKAKAETEIKAKEVADEKKKVEAEIKAKAEAATKAVQEKGVDIKAKPSGLRWPWQKNVEEEKPTQTKSTEFPPSPTSPYTRYDGLKPPTSPTPPKSAEAVKVEKEPTSPTPSKPAEAVKVQEKVPSPSFNGYVDLRSTSSNPGPSEEDSKAVAAQVAAEVAAREQDALEKAKEATKATFLWPWQKEADSEPSTPTEPLSSTDLPRSSTPLSPYSRYPDMKPPTSPTPSAPKVDSNAEQQPEKVLESASKGFRWPWQ